jgi:hypothetical protein
VRIKIFTTWAKGYAGAEPNKHSSYITDGRGRRDRPAYTKASGTSTKRGRAIGRYFPNLIGVMFLNAAITHIHKARDEENNKEITTFQV